MSIPDILLAVCVLILVWRVWRLEARLEKPVGRIALDPPATPLSAQVDNVRSGVLEQYGMIHGLARALGYEWKRTDAKEGWERCAVASVKKRKPRRAH